MTDDLPLIQTASHVESISDKTIHRGGSHFGYDREINRFVIADSCFWCETRINKPKLQHM